MHGGRWQPGCRASSLQRTTDNRPLTWGASREQLKNVTKEPELDETLAIVKIK